MFRNCRGFACGVFSLRLGLDSAFHADFFAVILAVVATYSRGCVRRFGLSWILSVSCFLSSIELLSLRGIFVVGDERLVCFC